jgi:dTDP-4-amino-4,6-dideoxygalactose transaminase
MKVPFLDLVTQHRELEDELVAVFRQALSTAGFIGGSMVEGFEKDFASFCGAKHCVGVNSGTDALRFALMAAGVGQGDVVVTVPNTFIATTEAVSQAGALPRFVDIDKRTCTMDPLKLREYLSTRCHTHGPGGRPVDAKSGRPVAAVVPVHLYGQVADMDPIMELAEEFNLEVVEDACQAHGAEYFSVRMSEPLDSRLHGNDKEAGIVMRDPPSGKGESEGSLRNDEKQGRWLRAGSIGHAAAFSFYPGKNLGACGEAGAVTTDDGGMARTIRMIRDHGQARKYFHDMEGYNGRLDAIQAGFLSVKLKYVEEWNEARRRAAANYDRLLADVDEVVTPFVPEGSRPVYHLYVIRVPNRQALQGFLADKGIVTGLHYPLPLHLQKAYADAGYREGDYPVTERAAREILSLPMFPGITPEQQEYVAEMIKAGIGKKGFKGSSGQGA